MKMHTQKPLTALFGFLAVAVTIGILAVPAGVYAQVASLTIRVVSPTGGEAWARGTTHSVQWNSSTTFN